MKATNKQVIYFVIALTIALGSMSFGRVVYAETIKWNLNNTGNIGPGYSNLQTVNGSTVSATTSVNTSSANVSGTVPIWKLITNPATGKPYESFLEYIQTPANGVSWSSSKQTVVSDALNAELSSPKAGEKVGTKEEILSALKDLPVSEQNAWLLLALSFGLSLPALQRILTKVGTGSVNPNETKVLANPNAAKLMSLIEANGGYASLGISKDDYLNLVLFGSTNFKDFIDGSSASTALTLKGLERYLSSTSRTTEEKQAILLKVITGNFNYSPDLQGLAALNMSAPNAQSFADNLAWNVTTAVNQRNNLTSAEVVSRLKPEVSSQLAEVKRLMTITSVPASSSTITAATKTQTDILTTAASIAASAQTKASTISASFLTTSSAESNQTLIQTASLQSTSAQTIPLQPLTKADLPNEKYVQLFNIYQKLNLGLSEAQLVSLLLSNPYFKQASLQDYIVSAAGFLTDPNPTTQYYIGDRGKKFMTTFLLDQQNSENFVNMFANLGAAVYSNQKQGISYSWSWYSNNYFNQLTDTATKAFTRVTGLDLFAGSTNPASFLTKLADKNMSAVQTEVAQKKQSTTTPAPVIPTTPNAPTTQYTDLAALEKQIAELLAQQQILTLKAQALDVELVELNKTLSSTQLDLNKLIAYNSSTNAFTSGVSIPAGAQLFFKSTTPFNGYNTNTVFGVFADGSYTAYSNQTELNKDMSLSNTKIIATLTATDAQNRINQYKTQFNQLVEVQRQADVAVKAKNEIEIKRLTDLIATINNSLDKKLIEKQELEKQAVAIAAVKVGLQNQKTTAQNNTSQSTAQLYKRVSVTDKTSLPVKVEQGTDGSVRFTYQLANKLGTWTETDWSNSTVRLPSNPQLTISIPDLSAVGNNTPKDRTTQASVQDLITDGELATALALTSSAIDFTPYIGDLKSLVESVTGRDFITWNKYSGSERSLLLLAAIPGISSATGVDETEAAVKARKLLKTLTNIARTKITKIDELIAFSKAFKDPTISQASVSVIEGTAKEAETMFNAITKDWKKIDNSSSGVITYASPDGKYKLNLRNFSTTELKPPYSPKPNATIDVIPSDYLKSLGEKNIEIKFGTIGESK